MTLVGYDGPDRVARVAAEIKKRFDLEVDSADGSSEEKKTEILRDAEVALCTAQGRPAGALEAADRRGRRISSSPPT